MKIKILFITHDTFRAGAQLLLLQFLRWLKINHSDIVFEILVGNVNGDLIKDFKDLAPTSVWIRYSEHSINPLIHFKKKRQILKIKYKKFNLIYSNTIVNGSILHELKQLKLPVITHVHEMDYWINMAGEKNWQNVKSCTNEFISASEAVKKRLVEGFGINPVLIKTIYEHVSFNYITNQGNRLSLKEKLHLFTDTVLIGASGAENWRKGKDWFIPLALNVITRIPKRKVHFVWIGGNLNYELKYDLHQSQHNDRIHFIPHLSEANRYFHEFAVFAMLSREDPFPVVNLEAASFGVPVVCFENAGGTPELIANGCGFSVPYGNLAEFADKIIYLIEHTDIRRQMGNAAIEAVKTKFDIQVVAEQLVELIKVQTNN